MKRRMLFKKLIIRVYDFKDSDSTGVETSISQDGQHYHHFDNKKPGNYIQVVYRGEETMTRFVCLETRLFSKALHVVVVNVDGKPQDTDDLKWKIED